MKGSRRSTGWLAGGCLLLGVLAQGSASAADIIVNRSDEKRTYDCQGGAAVINGGDNVLTLRNCTEVTVNGGDNLVDAGTARAINVLGSGNRVNWTAVEGRGKPKVVNLGRQNVIAPVGGRVRETATEAATASDDEAEAAEGDVDVDLGTGSIRVGGRKGAVIVTEDGTATVEGREGSDRVVARDGRAKVSRGQEIVIMESGRHETLDCGGGSASVVGNGNVLTLRNCREISVSGHDNEIDAGTASAISVLGRSNEITWTEGPNGARPSISNVGRDNVVKRRP